MQSIAEAATGTKIFQLYTRGDAEWVDGQVRQAMDLGYDAFCITVDSAVYSRRERDIAKRYGKPWRGRGGKGGQPGCSSRRPSTGTKCDASVTSSRFRLILKGIGTGEDAELRLR